MSQLTIGPALHRIILDLVRSGIHEYKYLLEAITENHGDLLQEHKDELARLGLRTALTRQLRATRRTSRNDDQPGLVGLEQMEFVTTKRGHVETLDATLLDMKEQAEIQRRQIEFDTRSHEYLLNQIAALEPHMQDPSTTYREVRHVLGYDDDPDEGITE